MLFAKWFINDIQLSPLKTLLLAANNISPLKNTFVVVSKFMAFFHIPVFVFSNYVQYKWIFKSSILMSSRKVLRTNTIDSRLWSSHKLNIIGYTCVCNTPSLFQSTKSSRNWNCMVKMWLFFMPLTWSCSSSIETENLRSTLSLLLVL